MNTNNLHTRFGRGARWAIAGGMTVGLLLSGAAVAQSGGGRAAASAARAGTLGGEPGTDVQSSSSISVNENGHQYKIEMKNGVVTQAQIDGQTVPDDRIENDGDVVRLKDDKGGVVYEYRIPGDLGMGAIAPGTPFWPSLGGMGAPGTMGLNGLGSMGLGGPQAAMVAPEPGEAPSVMMGVQMGVPDSTLCGHLGIDRDKSTMLTAVHETLPAAAAGLEPYDVIVSIDGKDGASPAMIREALKDKKPGDTLKLGVIHKGEHKDVSVKLDAYDWQKLTGSKAERIAPDGHDVFALATAPGAGALPPLPASIPEEYRKQIEQYLKDNNLSKSFTINQFGPRAPMGSVDQQRLLEQIERQQAAAAGQAQRARELARQMAGQGFGAVPDPGEMRQRMERMEKMLEQLMNEKLQQPQSQDQPPEPPAKDPATQS